MKRIKLTNETMKLNALFALLIVFGAEGPGIRPRVLSVCDEQVRIPMAGEVASLNVATVAAILAFEAVRQRSGAGS